ncbi:MULTISPECIES: hypothetical protein [unclassified Methanoregula]|uniref:hypothetical protein n=1 Tax=unclassified Methanoregula TaxID=2649730 RepID=UPI0025E49410|nr:MULTISPECIES: hypothetical protein [unclassified Methanoregula]
MLLIIAAVVTAGYIEQNSGIPYEIPGYTNVIVKGAGSPADLAAGGIRNPEKLNLPSGISRYDLVTFNIPAMQEKLKSGSFFPIRIRGKEYLVNITNSDTTKSSDGIITYAGKFADEKRYNFQITVGPDVILGYASLNGELFYIGRAEKDARPEYNSSPLHYIYSRNDIGPSHLWLPHEIRYPLAILSSLPNMLKHPGPRLCGGKFEVYEIANWMPKNISTADILTEKDFSEFPELDAVMNGGKNTKATCEKYDGYMYPSCIGGGKFSCEEGRLVAKYETILFYNGKYYELRRTIIS